MNLPLLSLVAALGLMGLGPLAPEKVTTAQKKIFEASQMDSQAERLSRPDQGCVMWLLSSGLGRIAQVTTMGRACFQPMSPSCLGTVLTARVCQKGSIRPDRDCRRFPPLQASLPSSFQGQDQATSESYISSNHGFPPTPNVG
jgi:hypothetical protein